MWKDLERNCKIITKLIVPFKYVTKMERYYDNEDYTEFNKQLGNKLGAARQTLQLSQKKMAEQIGISTGMVSKIEGGKQGVPAYVVALYSDVTK